MTNVLISTILIAVLAAGFGVFRLRRLSLTTLIFTIVGAIVGLLCGALVSVPLSKLPAPFGQILPILVSVVLIIIFIPIVLSQRRAVLHHIPLLDRVESGEPASSLPTIVVDTSVIIDGRIADIAVAGFVPGRLVVPRFVLAELQNIADSEDPLRRGRGRRGLEVLTQLQETLVNQVEIIDQDIPGIKEVDAKLVALAKELQAHVLTTDYNLNRVAQIQGVRVLNVNELSNAIRPVVIPGEELRVRIVQAGKEKNQGVGYLSDGTMIVVEHGDKLIGQEVATEVTRVFQTVAGKMIFATPKKGQPTAPSAPIEVEPAMDAAQPPTSEVSAPTAASKPHRRTTRNQSQNHTPRPSRHRSPEDRLIEEVNNQS